MQTISQVTGTLLNGIDASQSKQDTKTNQIEQRRQSCGGLVLSDDTEGQKNLVVELYDRFHAMKTYGKEPESLESITRIFKRDLGMFPSELIMKAISTHALKSQEFPTVADIAGLIMRGGKPEIKESDIISIRKKDGEFRTPAEWQMLRDWESQQMSGWDKEDFDVQKHEATIMENHRLREKVKEMEAENKRLGELLLKKRIRLREEPLKLTDQERIDRTVDGMRLSGAPQEAIDEFLAAPYAVYNT